jgi:hypothetical protein
MSNFHAILTTEYPHPHPLDAQCMLWLYCMLPDMHMRCVYVHVHTRAVSEFLSFGFKEQSETVNFLVVFVSHHDHDIYILIGTRKAESPRAAIPENMNSETALVGM